MVKAGRKEGVAYQSGDTGLHEVTSGAVSFGHRIYLIA